MSALIYFYLSQCYISLLLFTSTVCLSRPTQNTLDCLYSNKSTFFPIKKKREVEDTRNQLVKLTVYAGHSKEISSM